MDLAVWSAREAERRLAPLGSRWRHTQGVVARAKALALTVPAADREVLVAAAYLHDIGYAPDVSGSGSGFHPLDGARWLRAREQERLACLVAHHSGASFEAQVRGLGTALSEFPEEHSRTADALTYCDLTTDPEGLEVTPAVRLAEIESRHQGDSDVARGMHAAAQALAALIARMEERIARARVAA